MLFAKGRKRKRERECHHPPRKDGTIHVAINRPLLALRENETMIVNSAEETKAAVYHTLQSSSQCSVPASSCRGRAHPEQSAGNKTGFTRFFPLERRGGTIRYSKRSGSFAPYLRVMSST